MKKRGAVTVALRIDVELTAAADLVLAMRLPRRALQALLNGRSGAAEPPLIALPAPPRGQRSKILHQPDVRLSLERLLREPLTFNEMRRCLIEVHGADRAPSRTAIGRYARRRRIELGLQADGGPSIR